jgi:hypothetical protein
MRSVLSSARLNNGCSLKTYKGRATPPQSATCRPLC